MNELDEVWSEMLASAIANAEASGRRDVADYLSLKAANDTIRQAGVKWLMDSAIELATDASRQKPSIVIETESPYTFAFKGANLVGSLLRVRQGVRCLTIEAGWTRTPNDGFMRGGALAFARITHFGMAKAGADLMLARPGDAPHWFAMPGDETRVQIDSSNIRDHFQIFLGS